VTTREFDGSRRLSLRDPSEVERLVSLIDALPTVQPVAVVCPDARGPAHASSRSHS
jgi:hypothetical protein